MSLPAWLLPPVPTEPVEKKLLNRDMLHNYQKKLVNFQCLNSESMLWVDMGLGKTAVTLTSIQHMLSNGLLKGVLIVAPVRVARLVWRQEAAKWEHTKDLSFSTLVGTKDQRTRALLKEADVYIVNYENLGWLAETLNLYYFSKGRESPFDGVVFDEISKMKNSTTNRVKSLMKIIQLFKWKTGLTGTPASNGYKDLHGQYLAIDNGKRLGTSKNAFQQRFYYKVSDYKESAFTDTEAIIKNLIGDITIQMSAEDYLELPEMIVNNVMVEFDTKTRAKYKALEDEFFFQLDNGEGVEVFNAAALTNKCLQFSNGSVYPEAGVSRWEAVHDEKLDALEDIIEESNGQPILVAYAYRSDAERIMERFKSIKPINLTDCKSQQSLEEAMRKWATGQCRLMIGHPASMGHGIDGLQKHGNILVWFGMTWSLDFYDQFNARIARQGQTKTVICHHIMTEGTLDEVQADRIKSKDLTQASLMRAIKEYRNRAETTN